MFAACFHAVLQTGAGYHTTLHRSNISPRSALFDRDWRFRHPTGLANRALSIRNAKVGNTGIFSRGVLCTFIVTNILSLLLGAGLG